MLSYVQHRDLERALVALHEDDLALAVLADFACETGLSLNELMTLAADGAASDECVLVHFVGEGALVLPVPLLPRTLADVHDLREAWSSAMGPRGVSLSLDETIVAVHESRAALRVLEELL